MKTSEYEKLVSQIDVLKVVAKEYSCKTIENIIVQMEARKDEISKKL